MIRRRKPSTLDMSGDPHEPLLPSRDLEPRPSFLRSFWLRLLCLKDDFLDWLHWTLVSRFHHRSLDTLIEQTADHLETLRKRIATPFDPSLADHQAVLRRLWTAAFPRDPFPDVNDGKSTQWKAMGWQSDLPSRDIRGGGILSLQLLAHFAETRQDEFSALMRKERGLRSDFEYPFCAAGINVAVLLFDVLDLHGNACRSTRSPAGIGFLRLLETSDVALECIFAESMITLDELWLQRGATYMEFQLVQRELRWRVHRTLGRRWLRTLQHLETLRTDYR